MNKKNESSEPALPISMGHDELARIEHNFDHGIHTLDSRLETVERKLHQLTVYITSLEDALSHVTHIPNLPLELIYDHRTNTLWAETRRKLAFTKNEAALMSLLFTKSTGKPKKSIFQCSELAEKLKDSGEGIETAEKVHDTALRIKNKLDEFLNTKDVMVVGTKSFYFSRIAL